MPSFDIFLLSCIYLVRPPGAFFFFFLSFLLGGPCTSCSEGITKEAVVSSVREPVGDSTYFLLKVAASVEA
jgi:hypothetical protein